MSSPLNGKPITQNLVASFIWQLIVWGVALMFGAITSYSSYTEGVPLYKALINGALVFLALAMGGLFAAFIVSLFRKPKTVESGAKAVVDTSIEEPCSYKWLHDIADTQRQKIADYVRNECWILADDLLHEPLFIDFRFVFYSSCVYPLTAVGVHGSIRSGSRRLSGTPTITNNLVQNLTVGDAGWLTITQPLSREDATYILNHSDAFNCGELFVELKAAGIDEVAALNVHSPIESARLTGLYPKLILRIKNPVYAGVVNMQDWADPGGSYITLGIEIENPRKTDIQIETIKLATLLSIKNFISVADIGELYEEKFIDKAGEHQVAGKRLKNLAALPLVIVGRGKISGHLQFSLEGINVGALKGSASSLTLTDKFGEHHTENFSAVLDEDG